MVNKYQCKEMGDRIRKRRKGLNMTQEDLAFKVGYKSRSSINKIELGLTDIGQTMIAKIADALFTTPAFIMGDNEPSKPHPTNLILPLLGRIACGDPILAEENVEEFIPLPEGVKANFALKCKGDSMINARILDGDIVYIRQQPTVENGEIAAVMIDGEATLKRFYRNGDTVTLIPENPAYRPLNFIGDQINSINVIGKAVAFTSMIE